MAVVAVGIRLSEVVTFEIERSPKRIVEEGGAEVDGYSSRLTVKIGETVIGTDSREYSDVNLGDFVHVPYVIRVFKDWVDSHNSHARSSNKHEIDVMLDATPGSSKQLNNLRDYIDRLLLLVPYASAGFNPVVVRQEDVADMAAASASAAIFDLLGNMGVSQECLIHLATSSNMIKLYTYDIRIS